MYFCEYKNVHSIDDLSQVAIIIPFRDRLYQLPILLKHLIPFLQRQQLEFGIFVAEQVCIPKKF